MKKATASFTAAASPATFTEDDIRSYAEHLFEQSGRVPGRDVDNWLEARACLEANVPREESHRRLHRHINGGGRARPPETAGLRTA
jgi:hypothetical protein